MGDIQLFRVDQWDDLVAALNRSFQTDYGFVLLLEDRLPQKQAALIQTHNEIICFATGENWSGKWPPYIRGYVANPFNKEELLWTLDQAKKMIELNHENAQLRFRMQLEKDKLQDILSSALELSEERDTGKLCERILDTIRRLTNAEGATLYLANPERQTLRFFHFQNEKVPVGPVGNITLAIDETSMAGACAYRKQIIQIKDVYKIPKTETFGFNQSFDKKYHYRTKSAICIPLLKTSGDLVGVIQLLNSKNSDTFSSADLELGKALSAHIAVALETALLYEDIENLFEGFIKASVTAIESRDPTTSGHSERVAKLTLNLAKVVSESEQKPFRDIEFDEIKFKELRYAALLHDFGKIGVPESVLLKEKKFHPWEMKEILMRIRMIKIANPKRAKELDEIEKHILEANEPRVTFENIREDLEKIVAQTFQVDGEEVSILKPTEWETLKISKGSLTPEDRKQIESHVVHTFKFLSQIPWTRPLKRVPEIAKSHHEKLNGAGYPFGLKGPDIPFESQIMAVTDIYDALTANDRPYKKAVPIEKAVEILRDDVKRGGLNKDLVEIFIETKAYLL